MSDELTAKEMWRRVKITDEALKRAKRSRLVSGIEGLLFLLLVLEVIFLVPDIERSMILLVSDNLILMLSLVGFAVDQKRRRRRMDWTDLDK